MQSQPNLPAARGARTAGKAKRPYWLIGAAVVALVIGLAIGRWQMTRHSSNHGGARLAAGQVATANPQPAPASVGASSSAGVPPRGGVAEAIDAVRPLAATGSAASATQPPAKTVFLARSQAEADAFGAFLADQAGIVTPDGGATAIDTSVVVVRPEDADQFYRAIANENTLRASLGLAEITLIDLHAPAVSAAAPPAVKGADTSEMTVYVVASSEQAALLQEGLDQAAITRAMAGEPPLPQAVVRVVADDGADVAGLATQYGQFRVSVVDMRH